MERVNGLALDMMAKSNEIKNKIGVMRYPINYKSKAIQVFKDEYLSFFDLKTIRYIF